MWTGAENLLLKWETPAQNESVGMSVNILSFALHPFFKPFLNVRANSIPIIQLFIIIIISYRALSIRTLETLQMEVHLRGRIHTQSATRNVNLTFLF